MDLVVKASFIICNEETPKVLVKDYNGNNYVALEDEDSDYISVLAQDVPEEDMSSIVQEIYDDDSSASDFLDRLNQEDRDDIRDFYVDGINESDYSPQNIIQETDADFEWWRTLGDKLKDNGNMYEETQEFLKALGIEKIKELLHIKICVMDEGGSQ